MKRRANKLLYVPIIIIFIYSFIGSKGSVIENLDIPIGIGIDLLQPCKSDDVQYSIPVSVYVSTPAGDIKNQVINGISYRMGGTQENRQLKSNKKFLFGLEKIFILSEDYCKFGIRNILDLLLHSPEINDRAPIVVFKGKSEDALKYTIKGYSNSADYMEGIIKNSKNFNFFPDSFTVLDLISRVDSEGRNVVLPYLELRDDGLQITGLALFKKDKMIGNIDIQESQLLSLLKFDHRIGTLSVQNSPKEYITYYGKSKRKLQCYKLSDGNYKFIINLNLKGSITNNEMYKNISNNPYELNKFKEELEISIEKSCSDFITKIMSKYKTDVLGLGKFASAKYGKNIESDWNKVVCNSSIEVHVKVSIISEGRGSF